MWHVNIWIRRKIRSLTKFFKNQIGLDSQLSLMIWQNHCLVVWAVSKTNYIQWQIQTSSKILQISTLIRIWRFIWDHIKKKSLDITSYSLFHPYIVVNLKDRKNFKEKFEIQHRTIMQKTVQGLKLLILPVHLLDNKLVASWKEWACSFVHSLPKESWGNT